MFDYKDVTENLQAWTSDWEGSTDGKIHTYPAQPGTIDVVDNDVVKLVKEPLLKDSKGTWSQAGRRYLYDRNGEIYGVVFSTPEISDIQDIVNNKCWQHSANCIKLRPGMVVFVVPSERALEEHPNATGIKFKLA